MMTLITGLIGIAGVMTFLGIMLWWVKALPIIIIIVLVMLLLLYDFVQTLRYGEDYGQSEKGAAAALARKSLDDSRS